MSRGRIALVLLVAVAAFAVLGPLVRPVDPNAVDLAATLASPTPVHPLGTDESGRDVLARLMAGGRISLAVAVAAALLALLAGTLIGGIAGLRGGFADRLLTLVVDAALAIPVFFILLVVLTLFAPSAATLAVAIGFTSWMSIARLVRAEVLVLRESGYVAAARALGASSWRVFRHHLFRQLEPTLGVAASLAVAQAVLTESALSFLGLGVQPPSSSWGNMLTGAETSLSTTPLLAVYPGIL
ncbi:MAG: ABC transporter permease, partial [Gemmatimonadota bacterium]